MARITALALLSILLAGCIAIPLPEKDSVVYGRPFVKDEVKAMLAGAENPLDVKANLGEPTVNFGPQRVYVYLWRSKKGSIGWVIFGYTSGGGGVEPWTASKLLFVAFDSNGKMLNCGTEEFAPFKTLSEQVRNWLASSGLTDHVVGPRPENPVQNAQVLFFYRPSISSCTFPDMYDASIFKPSVEVDGQIVGDLGKGEYLAAMIEAGSHRVTIDPIPHYRTAGMEGSIFTVKRIPISFQIDIEPNGTVYVEAYSCVVFGGEDLHMHAVVRDAPTALEAMRKLRPAW